MKLQQKAPFGKNGIMKLQHTIPYNLLKTHFINDSFSSYFS